MRRLGFLVLQCVGAFRMSGFSLVVFPFDLTRPGFDRAILLGAGLWFGFGSFFGRVNVGFVSVSRGEILSVFQRHGPFRQLDVLTVVQLRAVAVVAAVATVRSKVSLGVVHHRVVRRRGLGGRINEGRRVAELHGELFAKLVGSPVLWCGRLEQRIVVLLQYRHV